jgi:hypothetical protein
MSSCSRNEGGKLVCNMTYNTANEMSVSSRTKAYSTSDRYTQFGDYITSVTPNKFLIKFLSLKLCSTWKNQNNNLEIIDNNKIDWTKTIVLGNTDSTFIYSSNGTSKDDPLGTKGLIIRSNKFNSITLKAIPEGEMRTITGIMTYYINDLIQIYAGKDNIPYTYDDVFVYAPRFWERISVSLNSY